MGSKVGVLLSFIFVLQVLLFGGDISSIQIVHSELDALATHVAQRISYDGYLSPATIAYVESDSSTSIQCLSGCAPRYGDTLVFEITRDYLPLVMKKTPFTIRVERAAVIGYYN